MLLFWQKIIKSSALIVDLGCKALQYRQVLWHVTLYTIEK